MHQYIVNSLSVQNVVYEYKCSVCSVSDAVRSVYQILCRASDYVSRGHRQTRDQPAEGRRGPDSPRKFPVPPELRPCHGLGPSSKLQLQLPLLSSSLAPQA
ncbi:hypothetical protein CsSME_00052923 [Camellia sinensis var. sinensis]